MPPDNRIVYGTLAAAGCAAAYTVYKYAVQLPTFREPRRTGRFSANRTAKIGALDRIYHVYVPRDVKPGAGLLIAFHGSTLDGRTLRRWLRQAFDDLADQRGFVLVYPDGVSKMWSDSVRKRSYTREFRAQIDEAAFVQHIIATMKQEHGISDVFFMGYSNGGGLAMDLTLKNPDICKGVAVFASQLPAPENRLPVPPHRPLPPFMLVHGTDDPIVPYHGGQMKVLIFSRGEVLSVDETREELLERSGIDPTAFVATRTKCKSYPPGSVKGYERMAWEKDGKEHLVSYEFEGAGHVVPIGDQRFGLALLGGSPLVDMPKVVVDFFGL